MTLLSCPFCGDNTAELREQSGMHYVECQLCKARGPLARDPPADAAKSWNERHSINGEAGQ